MDTIAEFSDNAGLTCKLTKDRFYVSSLGNEETFTLRGVNGIGIYDDLEKYNKDLFVYKNLSKIRENQKKFIIGLGIFIAVMGLIFFKVEAVVGVLIFIMGAFFGLSPQIIPSTNTFWWGKPLSLLEPKL